MHKLIALYRKPDDVEAFMRHYRETHAPLARAVPGLVSLTVDQVTGGATGGEAPYFLIATMAWADKASFDAAMASPENRAAGKDLKNFAGAGVTLITAED